MVASSVLLGLAGSALGAAPLTYSLKWGTFGSGAGQFRYGLGVARDSAGNIYVVDANNYKVQKYSSIGTYLTSWGSNGSGNGQFQFPTGIAIDSANNVYVTDQTLNKVQKFNTTGGWLGAWGSTGTGNGQFSNPRGIGCDSANNVYVVDGANNRVQKFNSAGTYLTKWGSAGSGNGQFATAFGLAVDASNNIYVADRDNYRVQKFNSAGTYLTQWGSSGSADGQFSTLYFVACDAYGNVYVSDAGRVQQFTNTGGFISAWGTYGSGDGQFSSATGLAAYGAGNLYVSDTYNYRVQMFTDQSPPVTTIPGGLPAWSRASRPVTLTVSDNVASNATFYSVNGALYSTYTLPVPVSIEGTTTFAFYSTDRAGNAETPNTVYVRIDTVAPGTAAASAAAVNDSSVDVTWGAVADATSGLAYYGVYRADDSLVATTAGTTMRVTGLSANTAYGFYVRAFDVAGNSSKSNTANVTTRNDGTPATTLSFPPADLPNGWWTTPPSVTAAPSKPAATFYSFVSAAGPWTLWSGPVTASTQGTSTLYYYSVDGFGNTEVVKSQVFKVCSAVPSGFWASAAQVSSAAVDVWWNPDSTEALDRYEIVRADGSTLATTSSARYRIGGLTAGSTQAYYVRLRDMAGRTVRSPMVFASAVARTTPTLAATWGGPGAANGLFSGPSGVAVDPGGYVYVVDQGNRRVQKFTTAGAYVTSWGTAGSGDGQFSWPRSVAVDDAGYVYISDATNNRIQKFTSAGTFVSGFGTPGGGPGQFSNPWGVAVDAAGSVFVADQGNSRVQKLTNAGAPISVHGAGQLNWPNGMCVDRSGAMYVADTWNERVAKFDAAGTLVGSLGTYGSGEGQVSSPRGVTVDGAGNVLVADYGNSRIAVFDSSGSWATSWPVPGWVYDVAVDASGSVYAACNNEHVVRKYADVTPPTSSIPSAPAEWTSAAVTATIVATDGAGVANTRYAIDGGPSADWDMPFAVTAEGTTTIAHAAVDRTGNAETTKTTLVRIDSGPPSAPVVAAAAYNDTAVDLTWTAAADAVSGVAGYAVFRADGTAITTTTANGCRIVGLTPDTAYGFYVRAFDRASNATTSNVAPATTFAAAPPVTTLSYPAPDGALGWWHTDIPVTSASSRPGSTYYSLVGTAGPWTPWTGAVNVSTEGTTTVSFYSVDAGGNKEFAQSQTFRLDKTPPAALTASSSSPSTNAIDVSWTAPTDALSGMYHYGVYRADATLIATTTANAYRVEGLAEDTSYSFYVKAFDTAGNARQSNTTTHFTLGGVPPVTTTSHRAPDSGATGWWRSSVGVTASAVSPKGVAGTYYSLTSASGPWHAWTGSVQVAEDGERTLYYFSVDSAGNTETVRSQLFRIDGAAPFPFVQPAVTLTAATQVDLTWAPSTDVLSGVAYYAVHQNGSLIATTTGTTCHVDGLTPLASYTFRVIAVDTAGNTSSIYDVPVLAMFFKRVVPDAVTTATPKGDAVGDIDGDGRADVVVADSNATAGRVIVMSGNGDGTLGAQSVYPAGRGTQAVALADVDGNGRSDVIAANTTSNTVSVLRNTGGVLGAKTDYPTGAAPNSVVATDVSGDGFVDVITSNGSANSVSVLLGNGSGGLGTKLDAATGPSPSCVAVGDLNADGRRDLVVAIPYTGLSVLLGNGDGTFQPRSDIALNTVYGSVALVDLGGDGKLDIATENSTLNGNGDGTFQPRVGYTVPGAASRVIATDFTGDGKPDLAMGLGISKVLVAANVAGTFSTQVSYELGGSTGGLAAGDLNGDGRVDLVRSDLTDNSVDVLLNGVTCPPPTTTCTLVPASPNGNAGWYVTTPTVTLSRTETGTTSYQWDATSTAGWRTYTGSVTASAGAHTLHFFARGVLGGVERLKSQAVWLDTEVATPTVSARGHSTTEVNVSWTPVADSASGIAYYGVYRSDDTTVATTTATTLRVGGLAAGTPYDFYVKTFDIAGNVGRSATIHSGTLGGTPPSTTISFPPAGETGWWRTPPSVTATTGQAGAATFYSFTSGAGPWSVWLGGALVTSQGGSTLSYFSVDSAGNTETVKAAGFLLDTVPPPSVIATVSGVTTSAVGLTWGAVTDGTSGLACYGVYRSDDTTVATTTATTYLVSGLATETPYAFHIRAFDVAGNSSRSDAVYGLTGGTSSITDPPQALKGPHGAYTMTTDKCGSCHDLHARQGGSVKLLPGSTMSQTCMACHNGTGARAVYGALAARGIDASAAHSCETTNLVPAGDPITGRAVVKAFSGPDGNLSCGDCHTPHGNGTVRPFAGDTTTGKTDHLLRKRPTGAAHDVVDYGSDWCGACHRGALTAKGAHVHPVETSKTAGFYVYDAVPSVSSTTSTETALAGIGGSNRGYVMPDGRSRLQKGHAPLCQQCHEDSRDAGRPGAVASFDPTGTGFPHETPNRRMLLEKGDGLCLNCHDTGRLR